MGPLCTPPQEVEQGGAALAAGRVDMYKMMLRRVVALDRPQSTVGSLLINAIMEIG